MGEQNLDYTCGMLYIVYIKARCNSVPYIESILMFGRRVKSGEGNVAICKSCNGTFDATGYRYPNNFQRFAPHIFELVLGSSTASIRNQSTGVSAKLTRNAQASNQSLAPTTAYFHRDPFIHSFLYCVLALLIVSRRFLGFQ